MLTLFVCSIDIIFPKRLLSVQVRSAKSHIRPVTIRSCLRFTIFFLEERRMLIC